MEIRIEIDDVTGAVAINGQPVSMSDLEAAASQDDPAELHYRGLPVPPQDERTRVLAAQYRAILDAVCEMLNDRTERARRSSVAACPRHEAVSEEERPFEGPIAGAEECRMAHGGVQVVERCRCGAVRRSNRNAGEKEEGAWS